MEQFDVDKIKTSFSSLLKEGIRPSDTLSDELKSFLQQFPYCQPLHIIQAIQNRDNPFNNYLSRAALCAPSRAVLYNLIHQKSFSISQTTFRENFYEPAEGPIKEQSETTEEIIAADEIIEDVQIIEEALFVNDIETVIPEQEAPLRENKVEEKPIFDTLAASDYFKFNESTADPLAKQTTEPNIDSNQVSKYDDDTMPYSFLWWLHKTRKEHADTYQPYVSFKLDTTKKIKKSSAEELNHQIIENIFHLQVPIEDTPEEGKSKTVQFEIKRKEEEIIERFIKEEPQIRPPKPDMIDTENKARKSSEDTLDLVSETLAHIYIEQMLYHKAIETYRKLSLKFPEKSTYFAGQITELQKKIN